MSCILIVYRHNLAILRGAFLLLSKTAPGALISSIPPGHDSPVHDIRHLLNSREPNDVYLFVSSLECVDPAVWGGTSPGTPAVLDEWEVQRIMQLLDSPDSLIRQMVSMTYPPSPVLCYNCRCRPLGY